MRMSLLTSLSECCRCAWIGVNPVVVWHISRLVCLAGRQMVWVIVLYDRESILYWVMSILYRKTISILYRAMSIHIELCQFMSNDVCLRHHLSLWHAEIHYDPQRFFLRGTCSESYLVVFRSLASYWTTKWVSENKFDSFHQWDQTLRSFMIDRRIRSGQILIFLIFIGFIE